jgi:hypothetical protein
MPIFLPFLPFIWFMLAGYSINPAALIWFTADFASKTIILVDEQWQKSASSTFLLFYLAHLPVLQPLTYTFPVRLLGFCQPPLSSTVRRHRWSRPNSGRKNMDFIFLFSLHGVLAAEIDQTHGCGPYVLRCCRTFRCVHNSITKFKFNKMYKDIFGIDLNFYLLDRATRHPT